MSGKSPVANEVVNKIDNGNEREEARFLRNKDVRPSGPLEGLDLSWSKCL